jgi:hypothetical protein
LSIDRPGFFRALASTIVRAVESLVAVIGTLVGTATGAGLGYLAQRAQYRREATERLHAARRAAYVEWLTRLHDVFCAMRVAVKETRHDGVSGAALAEAIAAVPAHEAQAALEHLRLVSGDRVACAAADQWHHMRKTLPRRWADWSNTYWMLRREFTNAARAEIGLDPLDWREAGVTAD